MLMRTAASVALLFALLEGVFAQIEIKMPPVLVKAFQESGGRIQGSTSTFGTPYFRQSLIGQVIYKPSRHHSDGSAGKPHCEPDQYDLDKPEEPNSENQWQSTTPPWILMVDRGGCTFRKKVYVAQQKEANVKAVIIVDNIDHENLNHIIVADDGWGKTVDIPSILITKEDGRRIKTQLNASSKPENAVYVSMNWDIPQDDIVVMEQWLSSANVEDMQFMSEFARYRENFGHQLQFNPHFVLHSVGWSWDSNACYKAEDKDYCYRDPSLDGKLHGSEVIEEDLRMMCIHDTMQDYHKDAKLGKYSPLFWKYMEKFVHECPIRSQGEGEASARFSKECSERVMGDVQVDPKKVQTCVNTEKGRMLQDMSLRKAWSDDATTLNGARLPGARTVLGVANAICDGYKKPPAACQQIRAKGGEVPPSSATAQPSTKSQKRDQLALMLASFGIVIIITVGGIVLYQRSLRAHLHSALREEVMLEVQSQMESYKQLPS